MLDDLLAPGLKLVVCGTAAGAESAAIRAYYAGPGNKFWSILFRIGLTPRQLAPAEYCSLLRYGIGLTDIAKGVSGSDSSLPRDSYDRGGLFGRIERFQPTVLCFNGKKSAEVYLLRDVEYGLQPETIGRTKLFVAPSTSGAANGYWDQSRWLDLTALVITTRA